MKGILCFSLLFLGTVAVVYIITQILRSVVDLKGDTAILSSFEGSWLFRLCLNILGYATIFVPGFLIFKYVKKSNYLERTGKNKNWCQILFFCCSSCENLMMCMSIFSQFISLCSFSNFDKLALEWICVCCWNFSFWADYTDGEHL